MGDVNAVNFRTNYMNPVMSMAYLDAMSSALTLPWPFPMMNITVDTSSVSSPFGNNIWNQTFSGNTTPMFNFGGVGGSGAAGGEKWMISDMSDDKSSFIKVSEDGAKQKYYVGGVECTKEFYEKNVMKLDKAEDDEESAATGDDSEGLDETYALKRAPQEIKKEASDIATQIYKATTGVNRGIGYRKMNSALSKLSYDNVVEVIQYWAQNYSTQVGGKTFVEILARCGTGTQMHNLKDIVKDKMVERAEKMNLDVNPSKVVIERNNRFFGSSKKTYAAFCDMYRKILEREDDKIKGKDQTYLDLVYKARLEKAEEAKKSEVQGGGSR